jgi:hypothetical protein
MDHIEPFFISLTDRRKAVVYMSQNTRGVKQGGKICFSLEEICNKYG